MSTETWGLMNKSQTDATLIETRISEMIAEHGADPTSHMGDGESISQHRENDVLDHPAGAVLADKWTMSEMDFTTTFESLTGFYPVGDVSQIWPGIGIFGHGSSTPHLSKLIVDLESALMNFNTDIECLIQLTLYVDQPSDDLVAFKYGVGSGTGYLNGMGLEVDNQTARFFAGNSDGTTVNYLSWPTYEGNVTYVVRLHNVPADGVVNVYINGELLGTLEWPSSYADAGRIEMRANSDAGYGNALYVRSLYFAQLPN